MKTRRVPFVDLTTPHHDLRNELVSVFGTALDNSQFVGGAMVQAFEEDFADFCEARVCMGVSSGIATTEAILQALPTFPEFPSSSALSPKLSGITWAEAGP